MSWEHWAMVTASALIGASVVPVTHQRCAVALVVAWWVEERGRLSTEAKKREGLQLLKDYRSWHAAFGGAMPLDETHVVDAAYGPAGYI